ncbi:hypothetical protein PPUN109347_15830 [Pseudomonas putida]|nr:hypothetical protein PPUN109347_15830 [Pseudomonas putida]
MPASLDTNKHALLSEFIKAISEFDTKTLSTKFSLPHAVILEINDLLPIYFHAGATLSAPPLGNQDTQANKAPLITVYDTGDGDTAASTAESARPSRSGEQQAPQQYVCCRPSRPKVESWSGCSPTPATHYTIMFSQAIAHPRHDTALSPRGTSSFRRAY